MNVHIVEHPNTAHADVNLYNGPHVKAPKSRPIKTAASIRAILLKHILKKRSELKDFSKKWREWKNFQIKAIDRRKKYKYKPECTISLKRNVANIAKYASN